MAAHDLAGTFRQRLQVAFLLQEIVGRAGLQRRAGDAFVALAGDHDHGQGVAGLAQAGQHIQAGGIGQPVIEQQQVERRFLEGGQCRVAPGGPGDDVTVLLQRALREQRVVMVVFDQQYV